ncbi:esterase-like activity of phytase family protein [Roseofilum casamattae]|uniref:Esterase-like activity of phytase family protein n=1 Tax=Roseofilum casamattae BLCC-M143 TaxID=3022442 RepID=A0ABT7BVX4_9CYAN|nr:esterase-like activity of phytase family protein [Roseofilum casamattae]MDJ1183333.1 esterase-like activity of phytase family protein [Roseofilum casamattae BLCC-M143]
MLISSAALLAHKPSWGERIAQRGITLGKVFRLPPLSLRTVQNNAIPNQVSDDRRIRIGGLFSGLDHSPSDPDNVFYAIADRGPNDRITVDGEKRRTFPVPDYTPVIYKLAANNGQLEILDSIPIRNQAGAPITGLPNTSNDEVPYDFSAQVQLSLNPNGLDTEGIARSPDGTFWLCDEYSPSVSHIAPNGTMVRRLVPKGVSLDAATDVRQVLPAIYSNRRLNRGFEGIDTNLTGDRLFVALQSPLDFPTKKIGRASQMMRLLVIDTETLQPIAEYVYVAETASSFATEKQGDLKLGGVAYVNPTTLLLIERTDNVARIYQVDLSGATNILGSQWDDPSNTANPLESLQPVDLATQGIIPVRKNLLVDLGEFAEIPGKIEGLAIIDASTIAIGNDNDFGFDSFDDRGQAVNNSRANMLAIVELDRPLPYEGLSQLY